MKIRSFPFVRFANQIKKNKNSVLNKSYPETQEYEKTKPSCLCFKMSNLFRASALYDDTKT